MRRIGYFRTRCRAFSDLFRIDERDRPETAGVTSINADWIGLMPQKIGV